MVSRSGIVSPLEREREPMEESGSDAAASPRTIKADFSALMASPDDSFHSSTTRRSLVASWKSPREINVPSSA